MAGVAIKVSAAALQDALREAGSRVRNMRPAYREVGELMVSSILRNFAASGRPEKWKPLAAARKRGSAAAAKPLIDTGKLRGSITAQANNREVRIGTNVVYAATHQFGSGAIPARPFVLFQDDDEDDIGEIITEHIAGAFR